MQRVLIWLAALCALLVTLAGLVIGAGYAWLRATVPSASGRLVLEGIAHPSRSRATANMCHTSLPVAPRSLVLGWASRTRRTVCGRWRLSRRSGRRRGCRRSSVNVSFTTDVFLRTLDLYGHAERSLAALTAQDRQDLEAYADGVNAFLRRRTGWFEPRLAPANSSCCVIRPSHGGPPTAW